MSSRDGVARGGWIPSRGHWIPSCFTPSFGIVGSGIMANSSPLLAKGEISAPEEINWERLDKTKFCLWGTGIFTCVTTCLYPLSVIKTRQMALPGPGGLKGVRQTAVKLWQLDGVRAFYKGFGTACFGGIPARVVYMSTLEITKSGLYAALQHWQISEIGAAGTVNFLAGAAASLCSQTVFIPIDVISQRLMVTNKPKCENGIRMNGLSMARLILREEGMRGLWRGFSASLMTYVPNNALWWASYGAWQRALWQQVDLWGWFGQTAIRKVEASNMLPAGEAGRGSPEGRLPSQVVAVQTSSALLAGATSACITTPLDVVKTRLQLSKLKDGKQPTIVGTVHKILQQDGIKGFMRGMGPRTANVALWGTSMVSAYEFLKRLSVRID